jgi:predicted RND superfamily exporter protein
MDRVEKFVKFLIKYKWSVMLFWGVMTLLFGFIFAANIMDVAEDTFVSPDDSDVAHADQLIATYFPELAEQHTHVVVVHNEQGLVNDEFLTFTSNLYNTAKNEVGVEMLDFGGYYIYSNTEFDFMKDSYISPDNTTSLITLTFVGDSQNFGDETTAMVEKIREILTELSENLPDSFNVYTAGFPDLAADSMDSFEKDMGTIDMIVIPIVFILLALLLRNWKYFPISMLSIIMSLLISNINNDEVCWTHDFYIWHYINNCTCWPNFISIQCNLGYRSWSRIFNCCIVNGESYFYTCIGVHYW